MKDFLKEAAILILVAIGVVALWLMDREAERRANELERIQQIQHQIETTRKFTEM